ncbi:biotin-dependent carboxyltransferase family protein [Neorhizobium sp. NCHU2750]|uniref:5-oxoprolinase subunit C family protein n=1 Tax=Neorhizobium sp. NCHU2750 TaxID=1825976 RepID=UPI000E773029|nr:allophanate hydrolase [Neorhizobium sp. NCHU2750]
MIHILATGPLNTVQDLGRIGFRNIGVTMSGAMDPLSVRLGNILLGNAENAAAIEVQTFPFKLVFQRKQAFAVTGADCKATLDGRPMPPWWAMEANEGQVLELSTPIDRARAYVCLAGGIDVPMVMGSRSTSLRGAFGGVDGRPLTVGDQLTCAAGETFLPTGGLGILPPTEAMRDLFPTADDGSLIVRAIPAAEHDLYGEDADRFWTQAWKISSQSDRTGYRLSGQPIQPVKPIEMRSHGVIPGVVQVPPGGEPIIQMSEANTAGGYPKIAGILDVDLWRVGQARIGSRLRFEKATVQTAIEIEKALAAYLIECRQTLPLVKSAMKGLA